MFCCLKGASSPKHGKGSRNNSSAARPVPHRESKNSHTSTETSKKILSINQPQTLSVQIDNKSEKPSISETVPKKVVN